METSNSTIAWFESVGRNDVARVGGKNASIGEMVQKLGKSGVNTPPGFATTTDAYWRFVEANGLREPIVRTLGRLDAGQMTLAKAGEAIRAEFLHGEWPNETAKAITGAYAELCKRTGEPDAAVAVRSSATAEDLPHASFAGQQETYLNIRGERDLLIACRKCLASLFTDRAISYRKTQGFEDTKVALSIGIQLMVRSDIGAAGVMFTVETETGFDKVVVINASLGLGENVVKGVVDPDEYQVFKPLLSNSALKPIVEKKLGGKAIKMIYSSETDATTRNVPTSKMERGAFALSDEEILTLARWACAIEKHYGCAMDIEWAKAGDTGKLYIVQARPETVQSRKDAGVIRTYRVLSKGKTLAKGLSIGEAVASGRACLIESPGDIARFMDGSILVTRTTDPDWVPIMKRAAAIITEHGGRTSHAAIISRELGLPAVIGAPNAMAILHDQQEITVSCAEGGEGYVYDGVAKVEVTDVDLASIPETESKVMLNLANPSAAFRWWRLPADGVGLARMEFVISNHIKVHPMALVRFDDLKDAEAKRAIAELTQGYADRTEYFVDRLARGLGRLAAAYYPKPVIIRTSDFKTNEYAHLLGGQEFEPQEENPMIGFRGASRYYSPRYRPGFALECRALKRLREEMGFTNVVIMIPFCRSVREADRVLEVMAENGLRRGDKGLEVYVMCEIPSNVVLAKDFAQRFDGFSIGSNDLTQLTLGVDRDSEDLAELFDEQDEAVKWMIRNVIAAAHEAYAKVGLCGQAPSDHPEFAEFLVMCGIDSMSVSPDSFVTVKQRVAETERMIRAADRSTSLPV
ncbi:MAG: phosphoenolpyruvate synthase [Hyphomonadaceae bacterium]